MMWVGVVMVVGISSVPGDSGCALSIHYLDADFGLNFLNNSYPIASCFPVPEFFSHY